MCPLGLPATLLNQRRRRGDGRAAARRGRTLRSGWRQADFFSRLLAHRQRGYQSSSRQNLTDWANHVWSIGPEHQSCRFFEGGRPTRNAWKNVARLIASSWQITASAVLTAYKDVEDQLSDLHLLAEKAALLDATVASAREYSRLTELQYRQGITDYLQVIDANQTLLTNELSAAQAQDQRLVATVLLIKALGGGWEGLPQTK